MKTNRDAVITVRLPTGTKKKFVARAKKEKEKTPSDVIRDLIDLYLNDTETSNVHRKLA